MKYESNVYQMNVDGHAFWVAESKSLKGCVGQGETSDEAIKELEQNEEEWIETAKSLGIPIPPVAPKIPKTYSGKIALRVSPYIHERASEAARKQGISLNQFINDAVAEYICKTENVKSQITSEFRPSGPMDVCSFTVIYPPHSNGAYQSVRNDLEEM